MLSTDQIEDAGRLLADAAASPAEVILFGSHARGTATTTSDLDFLVIEQEDVNRAEEMVRLREVLPPLGVPVDVIVFSRALADRRARVNGTVVHTALREGRVVARS